MNYQKRSYQELCKDLCENPPDTPAWMNAFAEMQRRRDRSQLRLSYWLVFFSGLVGLNAVLQTIGYFQQ